MKIKDCPANHAVRIPLIFLLGALTIFSSAHSLVVSAQDDLAYLRKVRMIDTARFGVTNPVGLAYSPGANALLLIEGPDKAAPSRGRCDVVMISLLRDPMGSLSLATDIPDPLNISFSRRANGLVVLDRTTKKIIRINANSDGRPNQSEYAIIRYDVARFPIRNPQGIASDPETGDLYVLDANGLQILRLIPGPGQNFDSARLEWIPTHALRLTGPVWPGRIAFNPENRHLYLLNTVDRMLYELTGTGELASVRDLSSQRLIDPQAMVFAPSGDQTDEPSIMSLYIADRGQDTLRGQSGGQVIEFSLTAPVLLDSLAATPTMLGSLANIIDTSLWSPPSPDPAGIDYHPESRTYWVCDSEVEEMSIWRGVNLWEMTPSGYVLNTFNTIRFSSEPTGAAHHSSNGNLFFSDDNWRRVFEINLGSDGIFGTADDTVRYINTASFGSTDPEGVAFDGENGVLFIADGVNAEVYKITPGANGIFDGPPPGGDDEVTHFDTASLGISDPEGIEYNPDNRTLFLAGPSSRRTIIEVTLDGGVVRIIDSSAARAIAPAGLAYGEASSNPFQKSIYLTDRAIDNGPDPNENDGKIYEFSITWPVIFSFAPGSGAVGTLVTVTGANFIGATSVAFNGTGAGFMVVSDTSLTATVPPGATTGRISVTTAAGTASSNSDFTVTVPAPPPVVNSFSPASGAVGTLVAVTGANFIGATSVAFSGTNAGFMVVSDTNLTATVPTGATTGRISVTTAAGTGSSSSDFTVTVPAPAPTVSSITPKTIKAGTSVVVAVTGGNFVSGANLSFENGQGPVLTVTKVSVRDAGYLTATVTAKSGGPKITRPWDVVITNPDGSRGVLARAFSVTK